MIPRRIAFLSILSTGRMATSIVWCIALLLIACRIVLVRSLTKRLLLLLVLVRLKADAYARPATLTRCRTLNLSPWRNEMMLRRYLILSKSRKTLLSLIAQLSPRWLKLLIEVLLLLLLISMLWILWILLRLRILSLTEFTPRRRRRLLLIGLRLMTELSRRLLLLRSIGIVPLTLLSRRRCLLIIFHRFAISGTFGRR